MTEHEMCHKEYPTWCIHCGRFDVYCPTGHQCTGDECGKFEAKFGTYEQQEKCNPRSPACEHWEARK